MDIRDKFQILLFRKRRAGFQDILQHVTEIIWFKGWLFFLNAGQKQQPVYHPVHLTALLHDRVQKGAVIQTVFYPVCIEPDQGNRRFQIVGDIVQKLFHLFLFILQGFLVGRDLVSHGIEIGGCPLQFIIRMDLQRMKFVSSHGGSKGIELFQRRGHPSHQNKNKQKRQ